MKAIFFIASFVFPLFLSPILLSAEMGKAQAIVEVGNKMCPVSGDKVSGKNFVEYEGKRYGLCCKMCADKFNKNPEKFIAMLDQDAEAEVAEHDHSHNH